VKEKLEMAEQAGLMRDVVVVGGGAAGLSAALTLARARRRVTVVDAGAPRNAPADGVHGLLAFDGLNPVELPARGRAEVTGYGCEIIAAEVSDVSCTSLGFAVMMRDGGVLHARRLAVASRMVARADVFAGTGIKPTAHLMGSYIAADPTGRTPVPGVWAAGNSTDLSAQVSAAAADGARAAAHINADLVAEDTDRAIARLSNAEVTR
jgi:thioredoxin reductase